MVNQNIFNSIKEKELEKIKEEIMNNPSLPNLYAMLLQNQNRASFRITTTAGNNLIPRVVVTNIMVYPINTDVRMEVQRQRGFNINKNSQHGIRPTTNSSVTNTNMDLHRAARNGSLDDAKKVVGRNRELLWLKEPNGGRLSLHVATSHGHKEVATFLAREYPKGSYALNHADKSPLYLAVEHNHLDLAEEMLRLLDGDSEARSALKKGKSIIHCSISHNNQEMLGMILRYQRDLIKHTNEQGLTPLSYAAYNGFIDIVDYIIRNEPKSISNYKNDDKSTPIHKACLGDKVEVLQKFPSNSLLQKDGDGRTILHLAVKERCNKLKRVVSYLLTRTEGKQMIKKKDENGCTPLDLAIKYNNDEVKRLIDETVP